MHERMGDMMSNHKLLSEPVSILKGVGEQTAAHLASLRIFTIGDLLEYYPFRYEDYRLKNLHDVKHDERVTVAGIVHSEASIRYFGKAKNRLTVRILVDNLVITAVFFNRAFLKKQLALGTTITLTGKWDQHRMTLTVSEHQLGIQERNELAPIYSVTSKITVKTLRKLIYQALQEYGNFIEETLPSSLLTKYRLLSKKEALYRLHYPKSAETVKHARRRIVYEEFLQFQLKMQSLRKFARENSTGTAHRFDKEKLATFIETLPFPLTGAQNRVVKEILRDMESPYRMNRLLQGDVGSGKTVVAAIALYATVLAGFQGALMVPTEILAEQHLVSLEALLGNMGVTVSLLSGSVKGKKRKEQLERLAAGEIDVVIGTHALIQEDVHFNKLGLVITDEQHRFGVEQRRILRDKGEDPDSLFMTATPIPRTLAITVFGDMDTSVIDELPAGRKQIETYWAKHEMLERVLRFVEKELQKGRQAYVICPLIEESETLDVQNAIDVHAVLQAHFKHYQVGLMHGRLHPNEKDEVMSEFSDNQSQILVSTTVVEVGVNVPNATVMIIYDAERFGLAQLHQLRGRVGRGEHQSYCILLADPKTEIGKERMRIMTETNDGFKLSERDLELRGPGDFFGQKQSGLPEFKVADIIHDYRALEVARQDAVHFINSDFFWRDEEFKHLRDYLEKEGALSGEKLD